MKLNLSTAIFALACSAAQAQTVEVSNAWVRSTVPGQPGTGAFMSLTARDGAKLLGASSPVAGVVEVHQMKMDGDIMTMRAVPVLELPAGQTVQLKPGGYHFMLTELKQPLAKGSKVPLALRLKDAKGAESNLELTLPVATVAPVAAAGSSPGHAGGAAAQHGGQQH
jgi:periplasmic copper chaperone A